MHVGGSRFRGPSGYRGRFDGRRAGCGNFASKNMKCVRFGVGVLSLDSIPATEEQKPGEWRAVHTCRYKEMKSMNAKRSLEHLERKRLRPSCQHHLRAITLHLPRAQLSDRHPNHQCDWWQQNQPGNIAALVPQPVAQPYVVFEEEVNPVGDAIFVLMAEQSPEQSMFPWWLSTLHYPDWG